MSMTIVNINQNEAKRIFRMDLLQTIEFSYRLHVLRVPGGWIFTQYTGDGRTSDFVPVSDWSFDKF
jgi:hypothetical protein